MMWQGMQESGIWNARRTLIAVPMLFLTGCVAQTVTPPPLIAASTETDFALCEAWRRSLPAAPPLPSRADTPATADAVWAVRGGLDEARQVQAAVCGGGRE